VMKWVSYLLKVMQVVVMELEPMFLSQFQHENDRWAENFCGGSCEGTSEWRYEERCVQIVCSLTEIVTCFHKSD